MRWPRRSIEVRWIGLDSGAEQLQAHVLAQQERAGSIDGDPLAEGVRLVVVSALRHDWLEVQGRFALRLGRQRHVQQARRGLPELLGNEETLRTSGLEGHAQIIVLPVRKANSAESRSRRRNVPDQLTR